MASRAQRSLPICGRSRQGRRWGLQPLLAEAQIHDALQALGRRGRRLIVSQEPALEVVVEDAAGARQERREEGSWFDLQLLERTHPGVVADVETARSPAEHGEPSPAAKGAVGLHQHAAELGVGARRHADWQPYFLRALHLDPHREHAVEVVLAGDGALGYLEVEVGLNLGRTPDALASFHRDLRAHRHVVHVAAKPEKPPEHEGQKVWSGLRAVGAGDGGYVLDVPAYVGGLVVDDGDEHDSLPEDAGRLELVTWQQLLRLLGVDREGGHEGRGVPGVYGQLVGYPVHQRVAPRLPS